MSFRSLTVKVETSNARDSCFLVPVFYDSKDGSSFMIPIGALTDWASTPPPLWPVLPPFGVYALACGLHDAAYRGTLLRQMQNGLWAPALLNKDQSDALLLEAMMSLNVSMVMRDQIYEGVHFLGWRAFRNDNDAVLQAPIVFYGNDGLPVAPVALMKDPSEPT